MESPGILMIEIYTYTGVPLATEYIFIKNYSCPSAPNCACFVDSNSFTVRCDLASAIVNCCKRTSNFAISANNYATALKRKIRKRKCSKSWRCLVHLNFVLHTYLYSQIDYTWDVRLQYLSYKWSLLKDATAWLSTLGGGHSALGESSSNHAMTAGKISFKQFKLALELGDEGLVYRCKLYYALSLIQRGKLSQSKAIIRWIYNIAKNRLRDEKLQVMCQGVWSKLRYHFVLKKRLKLGCADNYNGVGYVPYSNIESRNR